MSTRVMQQNNVAETLIGAVVIAVAVGFLAFAYLYERDFPADVLAGNAWDASALV